ncbi:MAG: hypothetical protein KDA88_04640 [Planctomycetaceae bacterium]|nr:hypothetical protein [Planctomycetaceae bacterium]MCB9950144.1 hypothetical protein [Planctomycetaceae bacterium]
MTITLKSSTGQLIDAPSCEAVQYSLFDDPDAWTSSPDATITRIADGDRSTLLIAFAPGRGYYVHLLDKMRRVWLLTEDRFSIEPEVVEIDDDYWVSVGLLCTRTSVEEAVQWFLESGTRSPNLKWVSDNDLPENVVF